MGGGWHLDPSKCTSIKGLMMFVGVSRGSWGLLVQSDVLLFCSSTTHVASRDRMQRICAQLVEQLCSVRELRRWASRPLIDDGRCRRVMYSWGISRMSIRALPMLSIL